MVRYGVSTIEIHTDGGSHGNPGPGGWAFVMENDGSTMERSGGEQYTTNNRMELMAVISALETVRGTTAANEGIRVVTDSQYVKNGITTWIHNWLRNGWKTAGKKPVKNQDLWVRLHELASSLDVEWAWVRGHAGNPANERCDALVQHAIADLAGEK